MRKIFLFVLPLFISLKFFSQTYGANNFTLISHLDPETGVNVEGDKYSSCWGWFQSAKNKEYAIACSQSGTYWIDISNPQTPTVSTYRAGKLNGAIWRECKTYLNYCYVISDDIGSNSFQIFDMQYLPDSVHKVYDGNNLFERAHTLYVDGNKLYAAYVKYSNTNVSSMDVYSLATPTLPVLLRSLGQDYSFISTVHDMYVRRDTVYASCGYQGMYVFKFNSSSPAFTQIGSLTSYTASGYNHSSALTPNGKTLVFTDEIPTGLPVKFANVTNISNIQILATANQYSPCTAHNPFIVNNQYCFMSAYEDGLQLYDISNPASPQLKGYFDTYPQGGGNTGNYINGNYEGLWSCYPFFPSKNIFALDQSNGIFILKTALYANPTGIEKNSNGSSDFVLSPSPADEKLFFSLQDKKFTIEIFNLNGEKIISENENTISSGEVDVRKLDSGIYFFKYISENGNRIENKKFIIAR